LIKSVTEAVSATTTVYKLPAVAENGATEKPLSANTFFRQR